MTDRKDFSFVDIDSPLNPMIDAAHKGYAAVYAEDFAALRAARREAMGAATVDWDRAMAVERKRLKLKKGGSPSDSFVNDLRAQLYRQHDIEGHETRLDDAEKAREDRLFALAKAIVFTPRVNADTWHLAKTAHRDSYRSQTSPDTYARGELVPLRDRLQDFGLTTHVRQVQGAAGSRWELWADCPPWMADAAGRLMTVDFWYRAHKRNSTNPRVYNPFLSWELYP